MNELNVIIALLGFIFIVLLIVGFQLTSVSSKLTRIIKLKESLSMCNVKENEK